MGIFDDAEKMTDDFKLFTPGYYDAVVTNAALSLSDDPGEVKFEYTVTGSDEYKNRKLWRNFKLEPRGKGLLMTDLAKFAVDVDAIATEDDLGQQLTNTIGKSVKLKVVLNPKKDTPGEFWTNAYLSEVYLSGAAVVAAGSSVVNHAPGAVNSPPKLDTADEIPF